MSIVPLAELEYRDSLQPFATEPTIDVRPLGSWSRMAAGREAQQDAAATSVTERDLPASKIPPHSFDAERAVLGGMLLDRESLSKAVELLESSDFYKEGHRKMFDAMLSLFGRHEAVDLLTVSEELKRRGEFDEVGGPPALAVLVDEAATAVNTGAYINIIREYLEKRALIALGADLSAARRTVAR